MSAPRLQKPLPPPAGPGLIAVARRVSERTFFDLNGDRFESFARAVGARALALGLDSSDGYAELVLGPQGDDELDALVELIANHETSFFRNLPQINLIGQKILPDLFDAATARGRPLRIWSAACASGEEPYTTAMLCADAHARDRLRPRVEIFATDLCRSAVAAAETAVYDERSIQNVPAHFRLRYLVADPDGRYRVVPEIRRMVRFAKLSLADPLATCFRAMDLILARNVLIYFNEEGREYCAQLFRNALRIGGFLLVGHAEMPLCESMGFRREFGAEAFAYRRIS